MKTITKFLIRFEEEIKLKAIANYEVNIQLDATNYLFMKDYMFIQLTLVDIIQTLDGHQLINLNLIPKGVQAQNYVYLRLELRK